MEYVVPSSHTQRLEEILSSRCEAAIFDDLVLIIALYLFRFWGTVFVDFIVDVRMSCNWVSTATGRGGVRV